jgi:hypothetical protein
MNSGAGVLTGHIPGRHPDFLWLMGEVTSRAPRVSPGCLGPFRRTIHAVSFPDGFLERFALQTELDARMQASGAFTLGRDNSHADFPAGSEARDLARPSTANLAGNHVGGFSFAQKG